MKQEPVKPEFQIDVDVKLACAHCAEPAGENSYEYWVSDPKAVDMQCQIKTLLKELEIDEKGGIDPSNGWVCNKCIEQWDLDIGYGPGKIRGEKKDDGP